MRRVHVVSQERAFDRRGSSLHFFFFSFQYSIYNFQVVVLIDTETDILLSPYFRRPYFRREASSFATASPTSAVLAEPPMSLVLMPFSMTLRTASSIFLESSGCCKEYLNIMPSERIIATGLTMPWPLISGAEPISKKKHLVKRRRTCYRGEGFCLSSSYLP